MKRYTLINTIGVELRKALRGKALWISVALGLLFCGLDLLERYDAIKQAVEGVLDMRERGYQVYLGYSLFLSWMGLGGGSYGSAMYYTVWPALAAMAFGWSYNNERISGVYNQIAVRVGVKRYFTAKHTAVFISGGLAFALPLLLNLLALALIYPAGASGSLLDCNFLCGLNDSHPWAYCLAWCGMCFLFGGAAACLCHVAGTYLRHGVMAVLTPYAILIGIEVLTLLLRESILPEVIRYTISPYQMVINGGWANPWWLLFGTLAVMTLGSYAIGYWQVKRSELV